MQRETEDAEILELILNRKQTEKGYRLLMGKYQDRLYWHIRGLLRNHQDADDVLQDTFIKVFRNLDGFEGKAQLYTWMYRIATNESMTFLKKKQRNQTQELGQQHRELFVADAYVAPGEAERLLATAMHSLPEKQLIVFQMRYFEELTYQEISDVLGTSVGALKASFHHAVKKIESHLEKAGYKR